MFASVARTQQANEVGWDRFMNSVCVLFLVADYDSCLFVTVVVAVGLCVYVCVVFRADKVFLLFHFPALIHVLSLTCMQPH